MEITVKTAQQLRLTEEEFELMKKTGAFELWPFKTKNEYEEQLKHQPFLSERKANA